MWRRLRQSNIPDWEELIKTKQSRKDPVNVVYGQNAPKGLTVLSGSRFMYFNNDTSQGYFIKSVLGNNLAQILSHMMKQDPTTDLQISPLLGNKMTISVVGTQGQGWIMYFSAYTFNWDKFLNAIVKIQRLVRSLSIRRCLRVPCIQPHLQKYKKISAFQTSSFALSLPNELTDLIVHEVLYSHNLKKYPPICRIEMESFKKVARIEREFIPLQ